MLVRDVAWAFALRLGGHTEICWEAFVSGEYRAYIEIVKGLGAKVLTETFWAKRFGQFFFLEPHFESGAGCWAGWSWRLGGGGWAVGVGRWGLGGWAAGSGADWAGAGLGQPRNGLLGLGAGGPEVGPGGGPGRGRAMGGLGGLGWVAQKRKLVYSKMATLCPDRKYELSNGQQQQAISIYFFLEGLGFTVLGVLLANWLTLRALDSGNMQTPARTGCLPRRPALFAGLGRGHRDAASCSLGAKGRCIERVRGRQEEHLNKKQRQKRHRCTSSVHSRPRPSPHDDDCYGYCYRYCYRYSC